MSGFPLANVGGVADPHSDVAAQLGTTREGRGSISDNVAAPNLHGKDSIYSDKSILFEAYRYWAKRSREYEKHIEVGNLGLSGALKLLIGRKTAAPAALPHTGTPDEASSNASKEVTNEKGTNNEKGTQPGDIDNSRVDQETGFDNHGIHETEWEQAQRAGRTATWGAIFYLITTDIFGPSTVPWAISQMGYGPGFALYTVFGIMAYYSGLQLWKIYCGLDSTMYPMRNYGDVAFRIFGGPARHFVNILQSTQFFLNIALIVVTNGQGLTQMALGKDGNGYICFVLAIFLATLTGFLFGQIRTLQKLSFLANIAIWLNVAVLIATMVVTRQYPPNYAASLASFNTPYGPTVTTANWPPGYTLSSGISGLMNCVFAYGGATVFNELMAEMRRPYDFWKGFTIAEIFIYVTYLVSGMVIYSAQGQFTFNPSYQGIPSSAYGIQTFGNAVSWITGTIAGLLYGNIGIKVFYSAILRDIFGFPPLDQKKGKWIWVGLVPTYWMLAFVLAAAVPQISNLTTFVGALCILQFSYTFPAILSVAYNCQNDAVLPEETYNPVTGVVTRVDSGVKRWMRGFRQKIFLNTFDFIYFLGALVSAGLGLYATIEGMIKIFGETPITPFTCGSPAL